MIRFRRGIRKTLLSNGKNFKYLLYVIGEIVLVVIGILIALGVNNRNNQKLDDLRVESFSNKLKIQLENNLDAVKYYIETNEIYYRDTMRLLSILGDSKDIDNEAKIDSLILFNSGDYHLNLDMNIIIEGRENGDLALISDDSLSQSIYYLVNYNKSIIERERITNSDLNNNFVPYLIKNYNFKNLIHSIWDNEDFERSKIYTGDNYKILMDQEFENLITLRLIGAVDLLESYVELKEIILDTGKLLE